MVILSNVTFYVKDLGKTLAFFERAFGVEPVFVDETGLYAQLETGETALSFAQENFARENVSVDFQKLDATKPPFACEISFAFDNVDEAFQNALKAGATLIAKPVDKEWGQRSAYVRDPNGILIEITSLMDFEDDDEDYEDDEDEDDECHSCDCGDDSCDI